eukprot:scaffold2165_cov294-Pinguiococcus_pyrenoidosus.AAC.1
MGCIGDARNTCIQSEAISPPCVRWAMDSAARKTDRFQVPTAVSKPGSADHLTPFEIHRQLTPGPPGSVSAEGCGFRRAISPCYSLTERIDNLRLAQPSPATNAALRQHFTIKHCLQRRRVQDGARRGCPTSGAQSNGRQGARFSLSLSLSLCLSLSRGRKRLSSFDDCIMGGKPKSSVVSVLHFETCGSVGIKLKSGQNDMLSEVAAPRLASGGLERTPLSPPLNYL